MKVACSRLRTFCWVHPARGHHVLQRNQPFGACVQYVALAPLIQYNRITVTTLHNVAPGRSQPLCIRHWRRAAVNLAKYDVCTLAGMVG